ncbi:MAG: hypothetical protein RJA63_2793, partial [Pseudomonadota bacterium]
MKLRDLSMRIHITRGVPHALWLSFLFACCGAANAVTPIVAAGYCHSLALTNIGTVLTWGSDTCRLNSGRTTPITIEGLFDVVSVAAGYQYSLAIRRDGSVLAWGSNYFGQLGDGSTVDRSTPVQVKGLDGVVGVAPGESHVLAVKSDGTVWTWGAVDYSSNQSRLEAIPIRVDGLPKVVSVSANYRRSMALTADGNVWTWGMIDSPSGSYFSSPAPAIDINDIVAVAAGNHHNLALRRDGTVWTWGERTENAKQIVGLQTVIAIAAGDWASYALKLDGTVWVWGNNGHGYYGGYVVVDADVPIQVRGISGATSISVKQNHILAQIAGGAIIGAGENRGGQLGNGTYTYRGWPNLPSLVLTPHGDGYLSLLTGRTSIVVPELNTPFFTVATGGIPTTSASVVTATKFNPSDTGKPGAVFVTATVPSGSLGTTPSGQVAPEVGATIGAFHTAPSAATAPVGFTLIQLTPTGWQTVINGELIPYATGVLGDQLAAQTILSNTDTTNLKGAEFCVGYGTSAQDMIANGNIRAVATIPGATSTASCVVGGTLSVAITVAPGWNLLGNPVNQSIAVADRFGNPSFISSVWKWDTDKANWQFYSPALTAAELKSYASAQGYGVLSEINPGDGYWVNAKAQADLGTLSGSTINLR